MEKTRIYRILTVVLAVIVIAEAVYIHRLKAEGEPAYRAEYIGYDDGIDVSLTVSKGYYEYENALEEWDLAKYLNGADRYDGEVFIWGEVSISTGMVDDYTDNCGISVGDGDLGAYIDFRASKVNGGETILFFNYEGFPSDMTKIDHCMVKLGEDKYEVGLTRVE